MTESQQTGPECLPVGDFGPPTASPRAHGWSGWRWLPTFLLTVFIGCGSDARPGIGEDGSVSGPDEHVSAPPISVADCLNRSVGCVITLEPVVTLSDSARPGLFGESTFVQSDASGRFIATTLGMEALAIFDRKGELVEVVGRAGDGPGEFRRVMTPQRGPADSLYAYDFIQARLSVFAPDMSLVRSARLQHYPEFYRADGSFIVAQQIASSELLGHPVHLFSASGELVRSFGMEVPQYRADLRLLLTRKVGAGSQGTVWMTAPGEYRIERWDPDTGQLLHRVPRAAPDWFVTESKPGHPLIERPRAVISYIWEQDGLVWLIAQVPDEHWEPRLAEEPPPGGLTESDRNSAYDWIVEVIEPATGQLVAFRRFPNLLWMSGSGAYVVRPGGIRGERIYFDVFKPVLSIKGGRQ
jgi:hypothetical protein